MMRFAPVLLCFLFFVASSVRLMADEEKLPFDYVKETRNHQFIFVMLAHAPGRQNKIRQKYRKSGLYTTLDSSKLLWGVNWYSFDALPCSDGHHLIRLEMGNETGDHYQAPALGFYQDGREIKQYTVASLVNKPDKLPRSISHYLWLKASHLLTFV